MQDFMVVDFIANQDNIETGVATLNARTGLPGMAARGTARRLGGSRVNPADGISGLDDASAQDDTLPAFEASNWQELDLMLDPATRALWCYMRPNGAPSFTPSMVRELNQLHQAISDGARQSYPLPQYYVMGSRLDGIYNLGGDLAFLVDRIRNRDKAALTAYAHGCVEAVHAIYTGFDASIISIGLVQGNALGGGLEGALCFHTLVAERGLKMGFPEVLFGSFPGMGAYSFLSRKIGIKAAHDMIINGKIFTSEEFFDMGIVDVLAEPGKGKEAVENWIHSNSRRQPLLHALNQARYRVNPIELAELKDVTDIWVDTTLQLDATDLRRMERLLAAQKRPARG